jgi:hypothetical protein
MILKDALHNPLQPSTQHAHLVDEQGFPTAALDCRSGSPGYGLDGEQRIARQKFGNPKSAFRKLLKSPRR